MSQTYNKNPKNFDDLKEHVEKTIEGLKFRVEETGEILLAQIKTVQESEMITMLRDISARLDKIENTLNGDKKDEKDD